MPVFYSDIKTSQPFIPFSSNSYSIETSTCQLFLSVSFNFMTLTLQALGLSFIFRERSEMSVFQTVMSLPCVCVFLQVEEVKKHNHCLAFSSAGPQSQTYYVSFDSFTEHLRWHRHAAKVLCVFVCVHERKEKEKREHKHVLPGASHGSAVLCIRTCVTASRSMKTQPRCHPFACL